jgi:N-acetylated-alpha-linked acidic dipeptidase
MRRLALFGVSSVLWAGIALAQAPDGGLTARFDSHISSDEMRGWMKLMAAEPNQVGSPHDKANAEWLLKQFQAYGWDAHIENFKVLYPTPISETLEMTGPKPWKATLQEPPIPGDSSSTAKQYALPAYVAFQGDGDVSAPLVYVNYGNNDDYKRLQTLGISVKGKIVIARYGQGWRGLKPKLAQDHGAIGCLIYSDPSDDGYSVDSPYPKGPARPPRGIQRGSVADMTLYPGDPLTPGVGATDDAKRLTREEAPTILKIPALPISYADAQVLLGTLGGPVAPENWRGRLPITYRVGPGTRPVHLAVKSEWSLKPTYNVIATLKGAVWCAAIIMTAGCSAPAIRSPGRSQCWQRPRRWAHWCRAAGSRSAPSSTQAGTPRSRCCWAPPNGPRPMPPSCSRKPCFISTATAMSAAFSIWAAARIW